MILVTGATGRVGREVAARLGAAGPLRVMTRDPQRIAPPGARAEVVGGNFGDPGSLRAAMTGVRAVFVVTADPTRPEHDANLVEAARSAGVRHLVKLSSLAAGEADADDFITRWQRANEERIRASGIAWTFLRPRAFMSNTLGWAGSIRSGAVVRALNGRSRHACIDPRDIAEVAVRALSQPGHEGRIHHLTGPEPLSPREQTAQLSEALGRPLAFEELTADQARDAFRLRYPEPVVEALLSSAERHRTGGKAGVEPTVLDLTGRVPTTFRTWAADHVADFG